MIFPSEHSIFFGLTKEQLQLLINAAKYIELDKNTLFIHEGSLDKHFYYIIEGSVEIKKNSGKREHSLSFANAGETVGEFAALDDAPRSASVITVSPCKLYQFDLNKLKNDPNLQSIVSLIGDKVGKQTSHRLRYINDVTTEALKKNYAMSIFSIRTLIFLSLYALSLNFLEQIKESMPDTTFLSVILILIFSGVMYSIVRQSGYPLSQYGLSANNAFKQSYEAVLYTIPVIALIVLVKWGIINTVSSMSHFSLFDQSAFLRPGVSFSLSIYFISMFFYSLLCPLQEFIVRGCIQSSFQQIIEGSPAKIKWGAILISNLLFASAHSHTSTSFALLSFFPGLFWGWLYYKQKSLVGVSISHVIIGIWAVFIVGFQNML